MPVEDVPQLARQMLEAWLAKAMSAVLLEDG
jgi:hypothetical protein